MSSLYYANALFSKYPAASSVFATGAFPEQTSCAFASNPQRPGYICLRFLRRLMQGLYPGGGAWQARAQPASTRGRLRARAESSQHALRALEQNLSGVCPGDSAKAAGAKEQRNSDLAAESNFLIYSLDAKLR